MVGDARRLNTSVIAFIGKTYEGSNRSLVSNLFIAASYRNYSSNQPGIEIQSSSQNKIFEIEKENDCFESKTYRDEYGVKYIHGFNLENYNYILTTQQNSSTQEFSRISKLIRILL